MQCDVRRLVRPRPYDMDSLFTIHRRCFIHTRVSHQAAPPSAAGSTCMRRRLLLRENQKGDNRIDETLLRRNKRLPWGFPVKLPCPTESPNPVNLPGPRARRARQSAQYNPLQPVPRPVVARTMRLPISGRGGSSRCARRRASAAPAGPNGPAPTEAGRRAANGSAHGIAV
jgi:hypothetical protein